MISMICEAASKAATKYLVEADNYKAANGNDPGLHSLSTNPKKLGQAHGRCNGAPGRGAFVCDCICHKPQGSG